MKKLLLLVSALFLFGCGTGGTGTLSSNDGGATNPGGGGTAGKSVGSLALVFPKESTAKVVEAVTIPAPEKVRYIVSKFTPPVYDEEGNQISQASTTLVAPGADIAVNGSATISLEVGTYRVDMVSYKVGTANEILKYYSQVFAIQQSKTTTVTVAMQRKNAFAAPLSVDQATTYDLVAPSYPFSTTDFWISKSADIAFTDVGTDFGSITKGNFSFTAGTYPQPPAHKDYFQGKFTLAPEFLVAGETTSDWQYIYPNPVYGEAQVVTTVETPGGVIIGGTFD